MTIGTKTYAKRQIGLPSARHSTYLDSTACPIGPLSRFRSFPKAFAERDLRLSVFFGSNGHQTPSTISATTSGVSSVMTMGLADGITVGVAVGLGVASTTPRTWGARVGSAFTIGVGAGALVAGGTVTGTATPPP